MSENWGRLDDQSFCECAEVALARRMRLEYLNGFKRNSVTGSKTSSHAQKFILDLMPKPGIKSRNTFLLYKNQKLGTTGTKPKIFTPNSWPKLINASAFRNVCTLHRLNKILKRCISTNWAPLSAVAGEEGRSADRLLRTLRVLCAASTFLEFTRFVSQWKLYICF